MAMVRLPGYDQKTSPVSQGPKENHVTSEARPRNRQMGRRMRYCEACGVGIGIMTREEYATDYIHNSGVCETCEALAFDGGDYDYGFAR